MSLIFKAYAKINLTLEALAKRPDGYHEIASALQTINLSDTLTFEPGKRLEFSCDVRNLQSPENLVLKAARLLRETTGCDRGASIHLEKKIPIAAGLGSGSTDAAATLVGLNQLWELNLSFDRLSGLAAKLGSDVPFFLYGGTALARGRGEIVTPLPPSPESWLVLLKPHIKSTPGKTAQLYSQLKPSYFTSGQHAEKLVAHLKHGGIIESSFLFNVFEQVAFDFFAGLSHLRSRMIAASAREVHLAGSGPTLFALANDKASGETVLERLKEEKLEAYLVHTEKSTASTHTGDRQC